MPVRESKVKANAKYDKTHTKGVYLKLNNSTDSDILEKLSSVPNTQGYIKQLIRQDLARTCPNKGSVSVPFSPAAMSILEEKAKEKGLSVPDLIAVIVNEQLLRTCSDSVPKSFRDPFTDVITKAIGTWNDKASSILSDERPYIVSDSVPDFEKEGV